MYTQLAHPPQQTTQCPDRLTKPQQTTQSPDRLYKALTDSAKPQKDDTKTSNVRQHFDVLNKYLKY